MSRKNFILALTFSLLCVITVIFPVTGCGKAGTAKATNATEASSPAKSTNAQAPAQSEEASSSPADEPSDDKESTKGSRDNTPDVLEPVAGGVDVKECSAATIDISNVSYGYVVVNYKGTNEMPKLQITGPSGIAYNYDLHGGEEVFNFTQGNGAYQIGVYENVGGAKYAQAIACSADVNINNEFLPYLYPNDYVDFNKDSNVVALGSELACTADNDLDVVTNVYNYVVSNITYDRDLAQNVTSTYLPDPDRTLELKTGICFDYAALMTALLRSQRIPTRLEVGYSGDAYHAWISTYIEDIGWVNGIVEFHGDTWELMDPTLASTTSERELRSYIGDGSKYVVCYEY